MAELTLKDVQRSLIRLSNHYPEADHDGVSLQNLSEDYFEDCQGFTVDVFSEAIKEARRESKFFPKVSDVLKHCNDISRDCERIESRKKALQIEEGATYKSEFDIRKNMLRIKLLAMAASKKIRFDIAEPAIMVISQCKTPGELSDFVNETDFMRNLSEEIDSVQKHCICKCK